MKKGSYAFTGKDCVACGNCVRYCRFDAMQIYKGLYSRADKHKCRACGKCIQACPAGVISLVAKEGGLA